ncbi:hypothetical protein [Paenibacillus gallinarum]|uniref:Ni2+-binding GTPase n=1 Tax=Paenibacillus gallinarum TaxID=2762232 RepID=A0ABR8SWA2_9BACL|nr:hypothetical protein [Paenibacillus gallinarum]MBD7967737.1 hypothetical protein [Paenibacillus gallinarum]
MKNIESKVINGQIVSRRVIASEESKLREENNRLRKALEETQKALQWGEPENAISRAFEIIHQALEPAKGEDERE